MVACRPAPPALDLFLVAEGFEHPLFLTTPPDDERLFVLEQAGLIRVLTQTGALEQQPFLDLRSRVGSAEGEQGLLGLAFHPDYAANGYFYVNYIKQEENTTISRFTVSADPNVADAQSETILLTIEQPYENHNGGMLAFGPRDGYLYIASGDGGNANDPQRNAQNLNSLLGKILRIDVNSGDPYGIPEDNPFVDQADARPEIWAYGLRNPWRFSFDRDSGDLWIADVGQEAREEINFQPANSPGGENYGWHVREGSICRPGQSNCNLSGAVAPLYDYHKVIARSVTGGYVYRGLAIPELQGEYLFADYTRGQVWGLRQEGGEVTQFNNRTRQLRPKGVVALVSSFGEDATGELYLVEYQRGEIWRVIPKRSAKP